RIQQVERPREPQPVDQKVIQAIVTVLGTRLQEQSDSVNRRLEEQAESLREEVKEMHREFSSLVAQAVGEQVAQRSAEMETRFQQRLTSAVKPIQADLAELRERVAQTENVM